MKINGVALFLVPGEPHYSALCATVRELSGIYHTPYFEPHVSISTRRLLEPHTVLFERAERLVSQIAPFSIKLGKAACGAEYFKCVFLEAEKSPALTAANLLVVDIFQEGVQQREYAPHMSLLYGDLSQEARREACERIGARHDAISFEVDRALVYSLEGSADRWKSLGSFRFRG